MRFILLLTLLLSSIFADFYIVSGDKKIKMSSLETGKIDFATFDKISSVNRGNEELHAFGEEIAFNHRHLNFRLATIGITQTNYTITEWSEKAQDSSNEYYINFADYTREDGVMLQLFYKNRWYVVVLGDPLEILHNVFKEKDLDTRKALKAIKRARIAFSEDETLKRIEKELEHKRANETNKSTKDSTRMIVNFN